MAIQNYINILTGGLSAEEQLDAASKASQIGRDNADIEARQTAEEKRRMTKEHRYTQGLARARAAASGVSGDSMDFYMESLIMSEQEEVDWLEEVGLSKYNKALQEGELASDIARSGAYSSGISALTNVFDLF